MGSKFGRVRLSTKGKHKLFKLIESFIVLTILRKKVFDTTAVTEFELIPPPEL